MKWLRAEQYFGNKESPLPPDGTPIDKIILTVWEDVDGKGIRLRGPRNDVPPSLVIEICEHIISIARKRL